jgi:AcrR family transcriptional regulator
MQQIADAAAVNKATLYHHVRDKEELFLAVMTEEIDRSRAELAAVLNEGAPLREQLRAVAAHVAAAHRPDVGR